MLKLWIYSFSLTLYWRLSNERHFLRRIEETNKHINPINGSYNLSSAMQETFCVSFLVWHIMALLWSYDNNFSSIVSSTLLFLFSETEADTSENRIKGKLCLFNGDNIFSPQAHSRRKYFWAQNEKQNFPNDKVFTFLPTKCIYDDEGFFLMFKNEIKFSHCYEFHAKTIWLSVITVMR